MNVTTQRCDERHSRGKLVVGSLVALTAVFLGIASLALQESSSAKETSTEVKIDFGSHAAAQAVQMTHIEASLRRIEKKLDAMIDK